MSDFKLEFTLKQHTPIIHFQSDQKGATLRVTELKPKLDRFLIEHLRLTENEVPKEEYKAYFIGNGEKHLALDYKIKIEPDHSKEIDIDEKNSLYFAARKPREMSQEEFDRTKKSFKKNQNDFKINFFSYNTNILEGLKLYFSSFLAVENFGSRQNKGFGSFYLSRDDKYYVDTLDALNKIHADYIYANYRGDDSETIQAHAEVIYPLMKTGINFPDHPKDSRNKPILDGGRGPKSSYYKSYLLTYMLNKVNPIGNEKRLIKENFFNQNLRLENDNMQKKYIRALLGVGDGVEFKDIRRGTIKYHSDDIARFKSPITFKIIENRMIIIANIMDNGIFNQKFTFSHASNQSPPNISTPQENEFNLSDFLFSFADYFNDMSVTNKNFFDKKILNAKSSKFIKADQ